MKPTDNKNNSLQKRKKWGYRSFSIDKIKQNKIKTNSPRLKNPVCYVPGGPHKERQKSREGAFKSGKRKTQNAWRFCFFWVYVPERPCSPTVSVFLPLSLSSTSSLALKVQLNVCADPWKCRAETETPSVRLCPSPDLRNRPSPACKRTSFLQPKAAAPRVNPQHWPLLFPGGGA